jgi:hypothetical protein
MPLVGGSTRAVEYPVVSERSEQLEVAFSGLMHAGEDRIDLLSLINRALTIEVKSPA